MIYYEKDDVVVRNSTLEDVERLHEKLRDSDVQEVKASHGYTPKQALELSIDKSIFSCTIEKSGCVVGCFGVYSDNILGDSGSIWFLSSDELDKMKIRFVMNSYYFVDMCLGFYRTLTNYVDARNTKSIEWLKFLGAVIEPAMPFGVEQLSFHRFTFVRK